jgi:hypothetical protein
VPVLTRSGGSALPASALPWLALVSGALAFAQFATPDAVPYAFVVSALCAVAAAIGSAAWMRSRGTRAVGNPHPCLHWYVASALCLAASAAAVIAMQWWPGQYTALKRLHLHLNTLGFVGLAAIGTLQVLMPTVAGRPDAEVANRLHRDLLPAIAGVVLVAAGASWFAPLAWLGAMLFLIPVARLSLAWWRLYRAEMFAWHGAAPALAGALAGFVALLAAGAIQSGMRGSLPNGAFVFVALFLIPLITGAAAALLPVLLRPGVQTPWHAAFRRVAGRHAGLRALIFLAGGITLAAGYEAGVVLSLLGLVLFVAQISLALRAPS